MWATSSVFPDSPNTMPGLLEWKSFFAFTAGWPWVGRYLMVTLNRRGKTVFDFNERHHGIYLWPDKERFERFFSFLFSFLLLPPPCEQIKMVLSHPLGSTPIAPLICRHGGDIPTWILGLLVVRYQDFDRFPWHLLLLCLVFFSFFFFLFLYWGKRLLQVSLFFFFFYFCVEEGKQRRKSE